MIGFRPGRVLSLLLVGVVALAACGPGAKGGKHLSVLAEWGGDEQQSFLAMVKPWQDRTGNTIDFTGSRDAPNILATRLAANNPPDLAGLPGPGQMADFAKKGQLIPLDNVVDTNAMNDQYGKNWVKLGTVDGKLVGIFIKASLKSLIWYDPKVVSGAGISLSSTSAPKTFEELKTITDRLANAGKTPWCIGLESGASSGWPGADWIQDIYMRQAGPSQYEKWGAMQVPWTDRTVRDAWQTFGAIVNDPKQTFGGKNYVLSTNFGTAFDPMFRNPPQCFLHHQATFITSFFTKDFPNLKAGEDFNFFGFPNIKPEFAGAQQVAGDLFGMFRDSPEARDFIKYLTTPEAQAIWVKRGGAISPNKKVNVDSYPDALSKQTAQILVNANPPEFSADDLMSNAMSAAFMKGVVDYVSDPSKLDTILANLERIRTGG